MLKSNYTENITNQEAATKGKILMDQFDYENLRVTQYLASYLFCSKGVGLHQVYAQLNALREVSFWLIKSRLFQQL